MPIAKKKVAGWKGKLTKKQRSHLREQGLFTLAGMARQKAFIAKRRAEFGFTAGCHECDQIIARLEAKGVRLPE